MMYRRDAVLDVVAKAGREEIGQLYFRAFKPRPGSALSARRGQAVAFGRRRWSPTALGAPQDQDRLAGIANPKPSPNQIGATPPLA